MIPYFIISKIMNRFGSKSMFHQPIDKLFYNSKVVKPRYKYPCQIQQSFSIENHTIITHHYNVKKKKVIFYFPGGAFIDPPSMFHYKFAKKIAYKTKRRVIMFQYPLFPEVDPITTTLLIKRIIKKYNYNDVVLMGDSAGANLALYVLCSFQKENKDYIKKVILISPWIDGKLENNQIDVIKQYDFVLDKQNCIEIAKSVYGKYLDSSIYLCPTLNDFKFKTEVLMFSGEHEIFTPDAIKWSKQQNILNVKHYVYKKMCHCFAILPIDNQRKVLKKISNFLLK